MLANSFMHILYYYYDREKGTTTLIFCHNTAFCNLAHSFRFHLLYRFIFVAFVRQASEG